MSSHGASGAFPPQQSKSILGLLLAGLVLFFCPARTTMAAPSSVVLGPGISGSWSDPAKNYQGFTLLYINSSAVVVTWFTYDTAGNQAWLQGVGSVQGSSVVIPTLYRPRGPKFGPGFNPADRINDPWGSLTIEFSDCSHGVARYSGAQSFPADTLQLGRLTALAGTRCDSAVAPAPSGLLRAGLSGAWSDPSHDGEGWMIEMLNDAVAVVYWFTYDTTGAQAWFLGVATITDSHLFVEKAYRPRGGRFGPGYRASDVVQDEWGSFALTITGCGTGLQAYRGPAGFGSDGYGDVRLLATAEGIDPCQFGAAPRSIAGGLIAASNTFTDGDVNNPSLPATPNDTPAQVQQVGNPAVISGFASAVPTGQSNQRFGSVADKFDAYRLPLTAGQSLQLIVSDWDANNRAKNDLDLWVFRANDSNTPIATAEGVDKNEFITVRESGIYDVVVVANSGFSNYVLVASSAPVPANAATLSSLDDFVPGELLVGYRDTPTPPGGTPKYSAGLRAAPLGFTVKQEGVNGAPALLSLGDAVAARRALAALGVPGEAPLKGSGWGLGKAGTEQRAELIRAIKAMSVQEGVRYAEPNYRAYAQAVPNDPGYALQWHYPQIHLPQAWDITTGNPNVLVAVADTGVAPHPDLAANVRYDLGYDFVSNPFTSNDGDGVDPNADDPGDGSGSKPSTFHGTHVAGTVAAVTNNGLGVAGVAGSAKIMPIRVLGAGGGYIGDIANGILWAAGIPSLPGQPPPARKADVLNMSLGGLNPCPAVYQEAIARARAAGVTVVVSAGNDNVSLPTNPASCPGVIAVSAVARNYSHAGYSSCGPWIKVAAPGGSTSLTSSRVGNSGLPLFPPGNPAPCKPYSSSYQFDDEAVWSTVYTGGGAQGESRAPTYEPMPGTSQAAPHVAGVIALMKSVDPGLTPQDVDNLLASGQITTDLGAPGWDNLYGYGLIDAYKAVVATRSLAGGAAVPPALIPAPSSLNFGETTVSLDLSLTLAGSGPLTIANVAADQPWLRATPRNANGAGFGTYAIDVNRAGLVQGEHNARLRVTTSQGTATDIPVSLRVGPPTPGEVGYLYLLVIDPVTGQTVKYLEGAGAQGAYTFSAQGLLPGDYVVLAGSDNDRDFHVCDPGDTCGVFPSLSEPALVNIDNSDVNIGSFVVYPDLSGLGSANSASASATGSQVAIAQAASASDSAAATGFAPSFVLPRRTVVRPSPERDGAMH